MLIDHVQAVFPDTFPFWFRIIGRLAFPIFAYLAAEGFRHTRSRGKFLLRLFIFALVSEPFFDYALMGAARLRDTDYLTQTNIFYTLFLGGAAIVIYRYIREKAYEYNHNKYLAEAAACLPAFFLAYVGAALGADYGWTGVLLIFAMYAVKKTHTRLIVMAWICLLIWLPVLTAILMGFGGYISGNSYLLMVATLLTVPLAACYNGKRGPRMKWFFYVFYPAHLAVLGGIRYLL
jgi:hypothetical protein